MERLALYHMRQAKLAFEAYTKSAGDAKKFEDRHMESLGDKMKVKVALRTNMDYNDTCADRDKWMGIAALNAQMATMYKTMQQPDVQG